MRFEPGRLVLHRNVRHGRIGWVRSARVVSDDDRGLLLWVARNAPVAYEVTAAGLGMRAVPFTEWITSSYALKRDTWNGPSVLKFLPTGAAHSVWWFTDERGRFRTGTSTWRSPVSAGTTARWPASTSWTRTSTWWCART